MQDSNFSRLLAHAGWGDPIRGLWFVGIEEGSAWSGSLDEVNLWFEERKASIHTLDKMTFEAGPACEGLPATTRSKVRYWEQAIVDRIRTRNPGGTSVSAPNLWSLGSRVFHANLYPLARPSVADWPDYFGKMFGLRSREDYRNAVESSRFPLLRDARRESHAQATVCFGKTFWGEFANAFALDPTSARSECGGKLNRYDNEKILCVPFFGYWHMSGRIADHIAAVLREWGVDLGY